MKKKKKTTAEQMSQEPPSIKRNLFYVYRVRGNAMKISVSHLACINSISI